MSHRGHIAGFILLLASVCALCACGGDAALPQMDASVLDPDASNDVDGQAVHDAEVDSAVEDPSIAIRLAGIEQYIDDAASRGGLALDYPVDKAALLDDVHAMLIADNSVRGWAKAVRRVSRAYFDNHNSLFINQAGVCGSHDNPLYFRSFQDACTQPYRDHVVVNAVGPTNPLGLHAGDQITSWNGRSGADMQEAVLASPLCANSTSSPTVGRYAAGTSLLAVTQPGDTLHVVHLDTSEEDLTVGTLTAESMYCGDPLPADRSYVVRASWVDESAGIALLDVPSLYEDDFATLRQDFIDALEDVPGAQVRIWNLRNNAGGWQEMGMHIASGFVGDQPIGTCNTRMPSSDPFVSSSTTAFGVAHDAAFAFTGHDIVLTDGLTFSAADWFAYTMQHAEGANVTVIGSTTAGAFGATLVSRAIATGSLYEVISTLRCTGVEGNLLEGHGVVPDIALELEPADLALGVDTVMQRAITEARALIH